MFLPHHIDFSNLRGIHEPHDSIDFPPTIKQLD